MSSIVSTNSITRTVDSPSELSREAIEREDGGPFMIADWVDPWMLHYRVDADELGNFVPFEVDQHEGSAYISVVSFSMRQLKLAVGGRLIEGVSGRAMKPCSHAFLNVRTYVRWRGEVGIYFLAEWVPSRVAEFFGPRTFGLPYRLGEFHDGATDGHQSSMNGRDAHRRVKDVASDRRFTWSAKCADLTTARSAADRSLDQFLMERYTAFTDHLGVQRRFRVFHQPWQFTPAQVEVSDASLLGEAWPDMADMPDMTDMTTSAAAKLTHAVRCRNLTDVWMSRPHWIATDLT